MNVLCDPDVQARRDVILSLAIKVKTSHFNWMNVLYDPCSGEEGCDLKPHQHGEDLPCQFLPEDRFQAP